MWGSCNGTPAGPGTKNPNDNLIYGSTGFLCAYSGKLAELILGSQLSIGYRIPPYSIVPPCRGAERHARPGLVRAVVQVADAHDRFGARGGGAGRGVRPVE